jgi:hypothetical protein
MRRQVRTCARTWFVCDGPRRGLAGPAGAQFSVIALAVGSVTWFTARCCSGAVVVRRYRARVKRRSCCGSVRRRASLNGTLRERHRTPRIDLRAATRAPKA